MRNKPGRLWEKAWGGTRAFSEIGAPEEIGTSRLSLPRESQVRSKGEPESDGLLIWM